MSNSLAFMQELTREVAGITVERSGQWRERIEVSLLVHIDLAVNTDDEKTRATFMVRSKSFNAVTSEPNPFHKAETIEDWQIVAYGLAQTLLMNLGHSGVRFTHDLAEEAERERLDMLEFEEIGE